MSFRAIRASETSVSWNGNRSCRVIHLMFDACGLEGTDSVACLSRGESVSDRHKLRASGPVECRPDGENCEQHNSGEGNTLSNAPLQPQVQKLLSDSVQRVHRLFPSLG